MVTNAPPSRNRADERTLAGVLKIDRDKSLQNTDDMLPARVIAYDRTTNRAQVQPLIVFVTTDNQQVARAQVASIPVLQLGGGGFVASFPVKTGDLGWIKANDRDISLFKSTYAQAAPNTWRKHKFSDAMFIPDCMLQGVTIAGEDASNLVIQNNAGTVKVAWWSNLLKIIAPNVGIGGTPASCALLDLQSTTKGFGFPSMTTSQKNAIASPRAGLAVWDTNEMAISTYNGSVWS